MREGSGQVSAVLLLGTSFRAAGGAAERPACWGGWRVDLLHDCLPLGPALGAEAGIAGASAGVAAQLPQ